MFETRPHIHGNRAQLYFHGNDGSHERKRNGYLRDKMQASVTVRFRFFYIIFPAYQAHVVLIQKHPRDLVNILHIAAHHAHARDIRQFFQIFGRLPVAAPTKFFVATFGRFQTTFDMMNRIVPVRKRKFVVEYFKTRARRFQRARIQWF